MCLYVFIICVYDMCVENAFTNIKTCTCRLYMHIHSVYLAYIIPIMHVGTYQGFVVMICSVQWDVLCWSMVQRSM